MNNKDTEAPERIWIDPEEDAPELQFFFTSPTEGFVQYARVDPPAAPAGQDVWCDACKSYHPTPRDPAYRSALGCEAVWYFADAAPPPDEAVISKSVVKRLQAQSALIPDEADKALAYELISEYGGVDDKGLLRSKFAAALAQARKQTWEKAIEIGSAHREHSGYTLHQYGDESLDCRNVIWRELESASKRGKPE